jgi:hypothetical protein
MRPYNAELRQEHDDFLASKSPKGSELWGELIERDEDTYYEVMMYMNGRRNRRPNLALPTFANQDTVWRLRLPGSEEQIPR